jgi:sigma-B regulation protein RsbU (phosphoserine phosphatase)
MMIQLRNISVRLLRRVRTAIDRRFVGEAYNAGQILTELGEAIPTLSKTKQLVELVADKISDALHPENITIFLDDEERGAYVVAYSSDAPKAGAALPAQSRSLALHYDERLVNRLRESLHLTTIDLTEADFLPRRTGSEKGGVLSSHEIQTLRAVRSSLLIPITSHGRLHGLISLGRRLSDLPYAKEDRLLLLVVANQIATFIENMKMISRVAEEERGARELELAAEVQRHLFPAAGLEDEGLEVYGTCLPARGVGGDSYDYFEMDEQRTGIAIADAAGKGIAAALLTSTVQASLRCQFISAGKPLTDVVSSMNRLLQQSTDGRRFATLFLAEFNNRTRRLTYVNAGHNPPMLVRGGVVSHGEVGELFEMPGTDRYLSGRAIGTSASLAVPVAEKPMVRLLKTGGPIIGTFLDGPYEQETILLQSGDIIAVYTDGVTEAVNAAGVEFGAEKLRSILAESMLLSARESAERIIAKILEWQGQASQHDDITLIILKIK